MLERARASTPISRPVSVRRVLPRPVAKPSKAASKSMTPASVTSKEKSVKTPDCTWIG